MGRKLELSHLSEAECQHILNVVHKDFNIRYMEKERLRQIEEDVVEEETKYSVLSKSHVFNEKNCICCFSRFLLLFNPRFLCDLCRFQVCKKCIEVDRDKKTRCCHACLKHRQLKNQSNEWFYSSVERKFKRCGSAKVIRSLYKRRLTGGSGATDDGSQSQIVMMTHSESDSATMTHPWNSIYDATDNVTTRGATLPKSFTMTTNAAGCGYCGGGGFTRSPEGQGHSENAEGHSLRQRIRSRRDGEDCRSTEGEESLDEEEDVGGATVANQLSSQSAQRANRCDVGRMDCWVQTDPALVLGGNGVGVGVGVGGSSSEAATMTVAEEAEASRCVTGGGGGGFDGMSTVSTEGHETDPQFVQRPHNIRVLEAEPLIVECKVNGTEPLDVLWFCNRNQVQQLEESERCELRRHGNAFTLTLFEMRAATDSLDYLCIAINALGQCAQGFTVAVDANAHASMAPQFTSRADVVEIVPEGGQAVLRCSLCAYPEPKVTWYRNNKKLMHAGRYRTESHVPEALHYSLVIDGVRSDDSGSYCAVASNVAGRSRHSLQLLVQPNVSETRFGVDEASASVSGADLQSNEDDLMRLAEGVSRTQGRYTTTATRMLRSADVMSSMQSQLDEMDRALEDLEEEVLDVISDDDEDDDEDSANNNNSRQLFDDIDDMKSSAEAVGMVTSAALQLLSSAKELAMETMLHGEGGETEDGGEAEEEEVDDDDEEDAEEEEEEEEEEECVDAEDLSLSYQELEKLFEVGLISRSQLRNRIIQKRNIKHIRSFLQSTMPSALKDSAGHAHLVDVDQSESGSAMDTSADSLEAGRDESQWKKMKKNESDDGERRQKTSEVAAAAAGGDGEGSERMVDNQLLKKTEEQIYLTSGKVFSLEDCIRDLERQVLQVDDDTPTETLASLENSVAKAVAQVTQSDHEVNDIERQVALWLKNSNKNARGNSRRPTQQQQQLRSRVRKQQQQQPSDSEAEENKVIG